MSNLENKRFGGGYCPPEITVARIVIEHGFAGSLTPSGEDDKQIDDLDNWEGWD